MDPNKKRPIKLIMNNEEEKDNIMSKLTNLKNAEDKFRRLSITDNYTQDERQEIKERVGKAELKNQEISVETIVYFLTTVVLRDEIFSIIRFRILVFTANLC